jgi:hypothetical protein
MKNESSMKVCSFGNRGRKLIKLLGMMLNHFVATTASQLTYRGLYELHRCIEENELGVLFRNNHFGVITKHKGSLYVLITDAGYKNEPMIWEKLDDVSFFEDCRKDDSYFI